MRKNLLSALLLAVSLLASSVVEAQNELAPATPYQGIAHSGMMSRISKRAFVGTAPNRNSRPQLLSAEPTVRRNPMALVPRKVANETELWGAVYSTKNYNVDRGFYSFTPSCDNFTQFFSDYYLPINGGAAIYDDILHFISDNRYYRNYWEYSTKDWTEVKGNSHTADNPEYLAVSSAYDATTGLNYGLYYQSSGDGWELGTMNFETFERTKFANCDTLFVGMAIDGDNWYGISQGGTLSKIDKSTGAFTPVGYTGVKPAAYQQAAAFDEATGKIYWAAMLSDTTSALYTVDPQTAQATKVADFPDAEEITYLYIPWHPVDKAPGAVTDLTTDFANGSLTGTVNFTLPDVLADSTALSGNVDYKVFANGTQVASGTGVAGQATTASVTIPEGGQTSIMVYADNDAGHGRSATVSIWAGPDAPSAVTDLQMVKVNGKTVLSWKAPATTQHGGYADLSQLTYTVVRNPGNVELASGLTSTTYATTIPAERNRYSFSVIGTAGGLNSEAATTDEFVSGTTATIPYFQDFNDEGDIDLMTVIDADSDGTTWKQDGPSIWSDDHEGRAMYSTPWSAGADFKANDWLLTPYLELSPEYTYTLTYDVGIRISNVPEEYAVAFGTGDDVTTFTQLVEPTVLNNMPENEHESKVIKVSSEGLYRVGFQALSGKDGFGLIIDNIRITRASLDAPDSVTALTLTPNALGNREATIAFTAPAKTINGNTLGSLDKIDVYRDDSVLVSSLTSVQPGQPYSVTDKGMTDDVHKYTVVPTSADGEGTHADVRGFVGVDRPPYPQNVHLTDNYNGTVEMSWDVPHTGFYGFFVNPDSIRYTAYGMDNGRPSKVLATGIEGESYQIDGVDNHDNGDQEFLYYAVSGQNRRNTEDPSIPILRAVSDFMITGAPMRTPFKESFAGAKPQNSMIWTLTTGDDNWRVTSRMAYDYDGGCASFYSNYDPDEEARLGTGKISMAGMANPKLIFRYYNVPDSDMTLKAVINAATQSKDTVSVLKFKDSTLPEGWQTVVIPLDEYKDLPYIWVEFTAQEGSLSMPILLDDIEVCDVPQSDLGLHTEYENAEVNMGGTARVAARIENHADNESAAAKVKFYLNGMLVDEQDVAPIDAYAYKYYFLDYPTKPTDPDKLNFKAEVVMDNDLDDENNTDSVTVTMKRPDYPVVDDLTASASGGNVSLEWTAPENLNNVVIDGFEDYDPFIIDGIGDWETYDGDGGYTHAPGNMGYRNINQPFAFQVFNPTAADVDLDNTEGGWDAMTPHSGNQYLISAQPLSMETFQTIPKDDWLISPQLDGRAQDISFWCRALIDTEAPETFEVLYSTGGTQVSDFQKIYTDSVQAQWTKFTASLPEGAKHFAIHAISPDKYWFMLDDISYVSGLLTINGYNIYRDGELVANVGAGVTAYTDDVAADGQHSYYVTVVYAEGESDLSNEAKVVTAIDAINSGVLYVGSADGSIIVRNAEAPVSVYTVGGALVGNASGAQVAMPVKNGVYLVKVGTKTFKLQVK